MWLFRNYKSLILNKPPAIDTLTQNKDVQCAQQLISGWKCYINFINKNKELSFLEYCKATFKLLWFHHTEIVLPSPLHSILQWITHCYMGQQITLLSRSYLNTYLLSKIIIKEHCEQNFSWIYKLFAHMCRLMHFN